MSPKKKILCDCEKKKYLFNAIIIIVTLVFLIFREVTFFVFRDFREKKHEKHKPSIKKHPDDVHWVELTRRRLPMHFDMGEEQEFSLVHELFENLAATKMDPDGWRRSEMHRHLNKITLNHLFHNEDVSNVFKFCAFRPHFNTHEPLKSMFSTASNPRVKGLTTKGVVIPTWIQSFIANRGGEIAAEEQTVTTQEITTDPKAKSLSEKIFAFAGDQMNKAGETAKIGVEAYGKAIDHTCCLARVSSCKPNSFLNQLTIQKPLCTATSGLKLPGSIPAYAG